MTKPDDFHKCLKGDHIGWQMETIMRSYKDDKGRFIWANQPEGFWKNLTHEELFRRLTISPLPNHEKGKKEVLLIDALKAISLRDIFHANPGDLSLAIRDMAKARGHDELFTDMLVEDQRAVLKEYKKYMRSKGDGMKIFVKKMEQRCPESFDTFERFLRVFYMEMTEAQTSMFECELYKAHRKRDSSHADIQSDEEPRKPKRIRPNEPTKTPASTPTCNACGRRGHKATDCTFIKAKHPCLNNERGIPFKESQIGKDYAAKHSQSYLHPNKDLTWNEASKSNTSGWTWPAEVDKGGAKPDKAKKPEGHKPSKKSKANKKLKHGAFSAQCSYCSMILHRKKIDMNDVCLPAIIHTYDQKDNPYDMPSLNVDYLPDTGAIQDNFINEDTAAWLKA